MLQLEVISLAASELINPHFEVDYLGFSRLGLDYKSCHGSFMSLLVCPPNLAQLPTDFQKSACYVVFRG